MLSAIQKNSFTLAVFALITTALLGGTYLSTREKIEHSERKAAQKALFEIIPVERHNNDLLIDTLPVPKSYWPTLGLEAGGDIHMARQDGKLIAIIIPAVAADGYSGDIKFIVGINVGESVGNNMDKSIDGSIAGVRVLSHAETPGLGDKVDLKKHDWILGFNGKSLHNPSPSHWNVKKDKGDFDQFTGATITPRAMVKQVFRTLNYYRDDGKRLIQQAALPAESPAKLPAQKNLGSQP